MNKQELDIRLSILAALETKLSGANLSADELQTLSGLLAEQRERETHHWRYHRAEQAINLLFPTERRTRPGETPTRPMWHEKSWWWNGAAIQRYEDRPNGDAVVNLSSYVGGGESDEIYNLALKREWLEADDMPAVIKAYTEGEAKRLAAAKTAKERSQARAELAEAQARLDRLG